MILDWRTLYDDLSRRGIVVEVKDEKYNVADNTIGYKFSRTRNDFSELLNEYAKRYEGDFWDCDDFALLLKAVGGLNGIAIGYAEGRVYVDNWFLGYHAFNLVPWYANIPRKLIWLAVEPQLVDTWGYQWFAVLPENSNKVKINIYVYEVLRVWL